MKAQTIQNAAELRRIVGRLAASTSVTDMHTHMYSADFEDSLLWGIDELLTYHYLISESFRWSEDSYEAFWTMSKREQADTIWKKLFVDHSPVSEAASGLITILNRLGLDVSSRNLEEYRRNLAGRDLRGQLDTVMKLAKVEHIVMTNDPFDAAERTVWLDRGGNTDPRFSAALRVDALLNNWPQAVGELKQLGYRVEEAWTEETRGEVRRFLSEWIRRMDALYLAVSMPGDFVYPSDDHRSRMIDEAMIPVCREYGILLRS